MSDKTKMMVGSGFLATLAKEDTSLETLKEHRVIPRLRIVQGSTRDEKIKELAGEGGVIESGSGVLFVRRGEPFEVVPMFMFEEFTLRGDFNDPGTPFIIDRSFDKGGELATRARNKERRQEEYGAGFKKRYVHTFCFAVMIEPPHPMAGTILSLNYEKGDFWRGKAFCNAMMARRIQVEDESTAQCPMWAQRWRFQTGIHNNKKGQKWWGWDYSCPEEPIVPDELLEQARSIHEQLKAEWAEKRVTVAVQTRDEDGAGEDDHESVKDM